MVVVVTDSFRRRHVFEITGGKASETKNTLGLDLEHGTDGIV
jgi:hypothetical protein